MRTPDFLQEQQHEQQLPQKIDNLADSRLPLPQTNLEQKATPQPEKALSDDARALLPSVSILEPGKTVKETVMLDGQPRDYLFHLPKNYDPAKKYPLILVFHGIGNKRGQGGVEPGAEGMETVTGLSERADQDDFIVAYLDGNPKSNRSWNNGEWFFSKSDDLKFTRGVMDAIIDANSVDESRIYFAGYSLGGSFAQRAAIEMSDRVAAVATIGAWMTGKEKPPESPVSLMEIHGGGDPVVRIGGNNMFITMKPHGYMRDFYLGANGMTGQAPTESKVDTTDGAPAYEQNWKNPQTGAELDLIVLPEANKHQYFGGYGAQINSIDTTDQFLKFFARHHNPKD